MKTEGNKASEVKEGHFPPTSPIVLCMEGRMEEWKELRKEVRKEGRKEGKGDWKESK